MRNLLLVARREYLEQIRGRAFKVTTILVPALFAVVIFIMIMASRGATGGKHIVIASNDAGLADEIRAQLLAHNETNSTIDVLAPVGPGDRPQLINRVRTGGIDGFLWVEASGGHSRQRPYTNRNLPATSSPMSFSAPR